MIFAGRNHRAPSVGHPPTINQCRKATDPASNWGAALVWFDETIFVFHMMCPDDFGRPPSHRAPSWVIHQQSTNAAQWTLLRFGVPVWYG
jgi:hypothetical protein